MSICFPESLTRKDWITLMWGFFWRNLCIGLVVLGLGVALGFILGLVIGIFLVAAGQELEPYKFLIQCLAGMIGLILGFSSYYVYIRWLLRSQIGPFRLNLIRIEAGEAGSTLC